MTISNLANIWVMTSKIVLSQPKPVPGVWNVSSGFKNDQRHFLKKSDHGYIQYWWRYSKIEICEFSEYSHILTKFVVFWPFFGQKTRSKQIMGAWNVLFGSKVSGNKSYITDINSIFAEIFKNQKLGFCNIMSHNNLGKILKKAPFLT